MKNRLKIILFVFVAVTTIALTVIARPVAHLTLTAWSARDHRQPLPPGTVNDASHLNRQLSKLIVSLELLRCYYSLYLEMLYVKVRRWRSQLHTILWVMVSPWRSGRAKRQNRTSSQKL
ncbi:hypothetical protein [Nostoc commune]|uniref:hypothetical protein n=1 Tax=Nostoc commune TaxID=1178 RepID=UPI002073C7E5|nr:hypothetical protein [Nostoc commune]